NEALIRRRELVAAARRKATVAELTGGLKLPGFLSGNTAAVLLVVMGIGTVVVLGTAATYRPDQCIADVREQKRLEAEKRAEELRARRDAERKEKTTAEPAAPAPS
ncbi:MAG: ABC transporter permease, partial [Rhodobacteraceae bacterium]|nr:ABC transporter permease [Paracoccaceae bacterium]